MQLNRWAVSLLPRGAASVTNDRASRFLPVPWVCASGWHQVFAEARLYETTKVSIRQSLLLVRDALGRALAAVLSAHRSALPNSAARHLADCTMHGRHCSSILEQDVAHFTYAHLVLVTFPNAPSRHEDS